MSLQVFAKRIYVCIGYDFNNQPVANSCALAFTSCLCRTSRLARDEKLGSSCVFRKHAHHPPVHAHSLRHVCDLLSSKEYVIAFQSPYGYLIHQLFLEEFWLSYCLPSLLSLSLGRSEVKLPLNIFDWCPQWKVFSHRASCVSSNKDILSGRIFQRTTIQVK